MATAASTRKPSRRARTPELDPQLQRRVIIEQVTPEIDEGRFPAKRTVGEQVVVEADIFADGHDLIAAAVLWRRAGARDPARRSLGEGGFQQARMTPLGNDRWRGTFTCAEFGDYEFTVEGWIDRVETLRAGIAKKEAAGQDASVDREEERLLSPEEDRKGATRYPRVLRIAVERERARFGAWYEMFPRSAGTDASRSATFDEAAARLPYIASMGFDVLYLPPIHPIGTSFRKGRNNTLNAGPDDPGSPWAIGSADGGHTAVEPGLGTLEDFDRFVAAAATHKLEVALDIAFQASPDHPYVTEHPDWFRHRPDGTIKYAENPPKKYQDIYPFDFGSADWQGLWRELKGVFDFWIARGIKIFRVDNPHTKPFHFWEWALGEIRKTHPDVIFLSEAFTRPKVMRYLAKAGFTQSYSYFTWRNSKPEIEEYFTELTQTPVREYMRPNLFANTPDILHEYLQHGGRPAFEIRLVLAATLGASYGIYSGFELCENTPLAPGSEEYLDSEKYQIRVRDFSRPDSLAELIARLNAIRRAHPALQSDWQLRFHQTDNEELICYSKRATDLSDPVLVIVNLDPFNMQHGHIRLPLADWGIPPDGRVEARDLLSGETYMWRGEWNYIRLDPPARVAHVIALAFES